MYFEVKEAQYLDEYRLRLRFEDESTGIADLSSYPDKDNVFRSFLNLEYFKKFRVEYGTIVWGKGELDIAPETLYRLATGKSVTYKVTPTATK